MTWIPISKTIKDITEKLIKIVLAVLFFLCLLNMPYGFYQLVRFAALVGFIILAYRAYEDGKTELVIIYVALAILFQPILKIPLGRMIWNIVDVIVGAGLIISLFIENKVSSNYKVNKQ